MWPIPGYPGTSRDRKVLTKTGNSKSPGLWPVKFPNSKCTAHAYVKLIQSSPISMMSSISSWTQNVGLSETDPIRLRSLLRLLSAALMAVQVNTPLPGLVCSAAPLAQLSHKHAHPPQSFTQWHLLAFWREAKLCQALFLVPSPSTSKTVLQTRFSESPSYGMGKAGACVSWTCLVAPGWSNKDMQWYERLCKTCGKLLCDALWGKSAARLCKCQVDEPERRSSWCLTHSVALLQLVKGRFSSFGIGCR